jgi:hypothetical protein
MRTCATFEKHSSIFGPPFIALLAFFFAGGLDASLIIVEMNHHA